MFLRLASQQRVLNAAICNIAPRSWYAVLLLAELPFACHVPIALHQDQRRQWLHRPASSPPVLICLLRAGVSGRSAVCWADWPMNMHQNAMYPDMW